MTRSLTKRLEKLEVPMAPHAGPQFIRILFVAPGGEITGEQVVEIGRGARSTRTP